MDIRRIERHCLLAMGLAVVAGCADPLLEDMGRPTGVNAPRGQATRPGPDAAARSQRPSLRQPGEEPASVGDVYLLYIVKARAASQGPYNQSVIVEHRQPGKVAWLLNWLTEPTGYGGTGEQAFLIYADAAVVEWAGRIAAQVDAPSRNAAWQAALEALLAFGGPCQIGSGEARRIMQILEPLCQGPGDPEYRWAACVLSGRLAAEVLGEPKRAAASFGAAADLSPATSPAWLVARHGQAKALLDAGDKAQARAIAQEIVRQAGQRYPHVRAYRQAQQIAQAKS